jgi:hypothetical protein
VTFVSVHVAPNVSDLMDGKREEFHHHNSDTKNHQEPEENP